LIYSPLLIYFPHLSIFPTQISKHQNEEKNEKKNVGKNEGRMRERMKERMKDDAKKNILFCTVQFILYSLFQR